VVSHDRELLDRMDQIAELDRGGIRLHGGGYSRYVETVRVEQDAAERSVRNAGQELKREKREMQQARDRAARRAGTAARNLGDAGLARIVAGGLKRSAEESAGRADQTHTARVDRARDRLDEAERAVRDELRVAFDLPDPGLPAGRTVFDGAGIQVRHGDRAVFASGGVDLVVRGPERIALTGPNGAGKSTVLRVLAGELVPDGATPTRSGGRVATLSQRLDLLDLDRTVAENLDDFAPSTPPSQRWNLLARFLFTGDRVHLPVRTLSGGERLRATLACVLHAEPVPQLLLLDEPTNNLDLTSVGQLESALAAYSGALVVVSHDERFLAAVGVDRWLRLADGRLSETGPPDSGRR
jgi:ATPase subunit of ABC transporter with duplicated ATPase domains